MSIDYVYEYAIDAWFYGIGLLINANLALMDFIPLLSAPSRNCHNKVLYYLHSSQSTDAMLIIYL